MIVHRVTPILNVSDMDASFAWFAKLGWKELWRWGDPTGFGAVGSGPCEIFMCRGGQGGRGKGKNTSTFASFEDETQDKGCSMSWWVEDVDADYEECVKQGIEVTWRPTDMPWNVREMHVRHPDGHVFRIGKGLKDKSRRLSQHRIGQRPNGPRFSCGRDGIWHTFWLSASSRTPWRTNRTLSRRPAAASAS